MLHRYLQRYLDIGFQSSDEEEVARVTNKKNFVSISYFFFLLFYILSRPTFIFSQHFVLTAHTARSFDVYRYAMPCVYDDRPRRRR